MVHYIEKYTVYGLASFVKRQYPNPTKWCLQRVRTIPKSMVRAGRASKCNYLLQIFLFTWEKLDDQEIIMWRVHGIK